MRRWQLQEAKNHFSDVVNRAHSEGPQIVTRRGVETAVVLSYDRYRELTGQKMTFEEFLLTAPKVDIEIEGEDGSALANPVALDPEDDAILLRLMQVKFGGIFIGNKRFSDSTLRGHYLNTNPAEARYTDSIATARLESGLRAVVQGPNDERLVTDMPSAVGGSGSAPSPGWFLRASVAACALSLATMRAAQVGMTGFRCEVEVDVGSDPMEVFVSLAPDGTCLVEPPVDDMQAASHRLALSLAAGWVEYGGPSEVAGVATPSDSWIRAGRMEHVGCEDRLTVTEPDGRQLTFRVVEIRLVWIPV